MSQKDLAHKLETSQNAIYRLENPKYGRPNISTLKKVASFFGVGLIVRFAALSELVDWTLNISQRSIDVPSFAEDLGFVERKPMALVAGAFGQQQNTDALLPYPSLVNTGGVQPATTIHHAVGSLGTLGHESIIGLTRVSGVIEVKVQTQEFFRSCSSGSAFHRIGDTQSIQAVGSLGNYVGLGNHALQNADGRLTRRAVHA
jgi:transcriptional regulator with XRE-family HTH domain